MVLHLTLYPSPTTEESAGRQNNGSGAAGGHDARGVFTGGSSSIHPKSTKEGGKMQRVFRNRAGGYYRPKWGESQGNVWFLRLRVKREQPLRKRLPKEKCREVRKISYYLNAPYSNGKKRGG